MDLIKLTPSLSTLVKIQHLRTVDNGILAFLAVYRCFISKVAQSSCNIYMCNNGSVIGLSYQQVSCVYFFRLVLVLFFVWKLVPPALTKQQSIKVHNKLTILS